MTGDGRVRFRLCQKSLIRSKRETVVTFWAQSGSCKMIWEARYLDDSGKTGNKGLKMIREMPIDSIQGGGVV